MLIALSLSEDFLLPTEHAADRYGVSSDTVRRGLRGLRDHGLLITRHVRKTAPLSPLGYTQERPHRLLSLKTSNKRPELSRRFEVEDAEEDLTERLLRAAEVARGSRGKR